jgi:hypothetical protein
MRLISLAIFLIGLTWGLPSFAQEALPEPVIPGLDPSKQPTARPDVPGRPRSPGAALSVYVITFGPGDHPFFKFGHNAIWIHDELRRTDGVYNFGTFAFGSPDLIPKFFLGRFSYWLSKSNSIFGTTHSYARENRTMDVQLLNLTPEQKVDLRDRLEANLLPANRYYRYDYYRDNCSTRVRDVIDIVLGGQLSDQWKTPGRLTYRQHTLRLTADFVGEYAFLDLMMGDLIDKPATRWEETFIPMELRDELRETTIAGPNGPEPLVVREEVFLTADRVPELADPPPWMPYYLVVGLLSGGLLAALGRIAWKQKAARVVLGVLLALLGFFFGFLGTFMLVAWAFTDHEVGYRNENVLLCAPWLLALLVYGIGVALGRARSVDRGFKLVAAAAAATGLALVLKVLPWFDQDNWRSLALFLPLWAGAAAALYFMRRDLPAWATRPPAAKTKKGEGGGSAKPKKKKAPEAEAEPKEEAPAGSEGAQPA